MEAKKVIGAIRNLKLEQSSVKFDSNISIIRDFGNIDVDPHVILKFVGNFGLRDFEENPIFMCKMDDVSLSTIPKASSLVKLLNFSMWVVKDNAVNVQELIGLNPDENKVINTTTNRVNSKSDGSFEDVIFTKEDFENVISWMHKVFPYFFTDDEVEPLLDGKFVRTAKFNMSKMERFSRAMHFIIVARGEAFLHAKITFYISAMEALLCSSESELRMQVAERSARLLGDTKELKLRIHDVVTVAYNFRSKYVHASGAKRKLKFFSSEEELSEELDLIVRDLLKLFIETYPELNEADNEKFNEWIRANVIF